MGLTTYISLLQPAPDVFYSVTDVIRMADGQFTNHGQSNVSEYFHYLGNHCPEMTDLLQDIPTPDGRRFIVDNKTIDGGAVHLGTDALVVAWNDSEIYKMMLLELGEDLEGSSTKSWPVVYSFTHCLEREYKLMIRNTFFFVFLFFAALVQASVPFAMMPLISEQRAVFYPTWIYAIAQSMLMPPLVIYVTFSTLSAIVYGSVGLSDDD
eukprot:gene47340-biopygen11948